MGDWLFQDFATNSMVMVLIERLRRARWEECGCSWILLGTRTPLDPTPSPRDLQYESSTLLGIGFMAISARQQIYRKWHRLKWGGVKTDATTNSHHRYVSYQITKFVFPFPAHISWRSWTPSSERAECGNRSWNAVLRNVAKIRGSIHCTGIWFTMGQYHLQASYL